MRLINRTIEGIAGILDAAFDGDIPIHREWLQQDTEMPCFFILNTSSKQSFGTRAGVKRYHIENTFEVHYLPSERDSREEMYNKGEKLYELLEIVTLDDGVKLLGTDMGFNIRNEILIFQVTLNAWEKSVETDDDMETMELMQTLEEI